MAYFAHTHPDFPSDSSAWEPLFTPFGEGEHECQREKCCKCKNLEPYHGHLNKVAFWSAKFAAEMFSNNSQESVNPYQWGYLTGLWHDLGKFSQNFQDCLKGSPLPVDHSTAGAVHSLDLKTFGPRISYLIAGHHAGLADGNYLFKERLKKEIPDWYANAQASGVPLDSKLPNPPLNRPSFQILDASRQVVLK